MRVRRRVGLGGRLLVEGVSIGSILGKQGDSYTPVLENMVAHILSGMMQNITDGKHGADRESKQYVVQYF